MNDQEFSKWANRLFVQYPSLYEWLHKNSPDPLATQAIWRDGLRQYSLAECLWVLEVWARDSSQPFAAYEKDQVPAIVRSVIQKRRDKEAAKQDHEQRAREFVARRGRNHRAYAGIIEHDAAMRAAYEEGAPLKIQLDAGELSREVYDRNLKAIIERHLSQPTSGPKVIQSSDQPLLATVHQEYAGELATCPSS